MDERGAKGRKKGAKKIRAPSSVKKDATLSKKLVVFVVVNGVLWIWCTYILAFMGYSQIAETLSNNVCNVVLGQLAFYFVTKTVENVFKYNNFGGKSEKAAEPNVNETEDTENGAG